MNKIQYARQLCHCDINAPCWLICSSWILVGNSGQSTCEWHNIIGYQSWVCRDEDQESINNYTGDAMLVQVPEEVRLENLQRYFWVWLLRTDFSRIPVCTNMRLMRKKRQKSNESTNFFFCGWFMLTSLKALEIRRFLRILCAFLEGNQMNEKLFSFDLRAIHLVLYHGKLTHFQGSQKNFCHHRHFSKWCSIINFI